MVSKASLIVICMMICSQLVDYCYLMAGVHLFNDGRWPGYVTPEDLANVIADPSGVTYG